MTVRIALIHATPVAMEPIANAFRSGWPDAELMNVLDDALSADRARVADLTPAMYDRFQRLVHYAVDYGSRGVLFTCSAFGPAIEAAARAVRVPVLKPNEAMFDAALARGERIGMVATFAPAVESMSEEFREASARHGGSAQLESVVAAGAMDALRAGDEAAHNAAVADAAKSLAHCDAIMLAHFSTARALAATQAAVRCPVHSSPDAAAARMRQVVERRA